MKDNRLDRIIRDKLKGLHPDIQHESWERLEQQLDAEGGADPGAEPTQDQFDDIFRHKLAGLSPLYSETHWDLFEQKLDMESAGVPGPEDQLIDETAFDRLHRLEVPYHPNHWQRMADLLDREFVRPSQILAYKMMELSLMALMLLTIWRSLHLLVPASPAEITTPAVQQPVAEMPSSSDTDISSQPIALQAEADEEKTAAGPAVGKAESNASVLSTPLVSAPEKPVVEASPAQVAPVSPIVSSPSFPGELQSLQADFRRLSELSSLEQALVAHTQKDFPAPPAKADLLAALEPLPSNLLHAPARNETIAGTQPVPVNRFINIGMFGSLDYNRIISPAFWLLDTPLSEFDRYELGYSGGVSVGFETGRLEIQTGLIYSSKHYQPQQAEILYGRFDQGYIREQLKDIQLDIVQLPLNFRYNFLQKDRWRLYALAGASLQIATQADYFFDNSGATFRSATLRPNRGWFDGGSFRENSYLTANVGLGLERFVTTRWSIFAQPTYQQAINFFNQGLGPTQDRISTMSIYTGIRVRLKR